LANATGFGLEVPFFQKTWKEQKYGQTNRFLNGFHQSTKIKRKFTLMETTRSGYGREPLHWGWMNL
jgi:hypothetical protein